VLAISIDVELNPQRRGLNQQRSLEEITRRLIDLLGKHQMPATWAVADPAISAATDRLVSAGAGHEIAILGDRTWVGREAGRSRFHRELARRITRGRAAGLPISTLALRNVELDDHLDLLVKQGITVVRPASEVCARSGWFSRRARQPQALRFGLWEAPGSLRLPGPTRSIAGLCGSWSARRGIKGAVDGPGVYHLVIDGLLLAKRGSSGLRMLDKILRYAGKWRRRETLDVATLSGLAKGLSGRRHAAPAKSILRPAA
jgi:hypothetical protein